MKASLARTRIRNPRLGYASGSDKVAIVPGSLIVSTGGRLGANGAVTSRRDLRDPRTLPSRRHCDDYRNANNAAYLQEKQREAQRGDGIGGGHHDVGYRLSDPRSQHGNC